MSAESMKADPLGLTAGTRVLLHEISDWSETDGTRGVPAQHAEYLGNGVFVIDEADRVPEDVDGLAEVLDSEDFTVLENPAAS